MVPLPHILIHGRDVLLLETRRRILERGPFRVTTQIKTAGSDLLMPGRIDLLVLCHTLNDADRQSAIEQYQHSSGQTRVIVLAKDASLHRDSPDTEILRVSAGPAALVASVERLLSTQDLVPSPNE
jgi:hypothetical protein